MAGHVDRSARAAAYPPARWAAISASVLVAAFAGVPASAVTYIGLASSGYGTSTVAQGTTTEPTSYTVDDRGHAQTSASEANGTSSTSQVSASKTPQYTPAEYAFAETTIKFTFQVVGAPFTTVPVHVHAYGYAEGSGEAFQAQSTVRVDPAGIGGAIEVDAYANRIYGGYNSFDIDEIVYVLTNFDNLVTTISFVYAGGSDGAGNHSGSALAYVDPTFSLDADYADKFTLVGVPGLAAAVPEPSLWAAMMVGLGAVGSRLRADRRRRRACPTATPLLQGS